MRKEDGAITIEAAISLVVTISVVLTLSLFARVVYVHGVVQHALIQSANELATFSYFYSMAGLDQVNKEINAKQATTNEEIDKAMNDINEIKKAFGEGDVVGAANSAGQISINDVVDFFKALAEAAVYKGAQAGETAIINKASQTFIQSYFPKDRAKFYSIGMFVDENGHYVKQDNFPIDLSASEYFQNADADEIHVVAVYSIKIVTPIPVINRNITMVQNAKARAWTAVWKESNSSTNNKNENEESSVWDYPPAQRAEKIAKTNSALNLDPNFKTIRGFESSTGKASMFVSVNLNDDTYKGNSKKIKSVIKRKMNSLSEYNGYKISGTEVPADAIKTVDYYVYIPQDASEADKAAVRSLAGVTDFKMDNGNEIKLNIIVSEVK